MEWPLTLVRIVKTIPGKDERTIVLATSAEGDYVFKIAHRDKPGITELMGELMGIKN